MKSQIISMDFIMTFVVYIFALSVFFYALGDTLPANTADLDVQADLLFNKLAEISETVDFLDNSRVDSAKLAAFSSDYNYRYAYELIFRDFDSPAFRRTDYCIYLENPETNQIVTNVAGGYEEDYSIYFEDSIKCGESTSNVYTEQPYCAINIKSESIVLTKPVLYNNDIMHLKVLICGEKP